MWKWIGFLLGLTTKGPLGAMLGFGVGWWLDANVRQFMGHSRRGHAGFSFFGGGRQAQSIFQTSLFGALGHLSKADGRVTEREIAIAEELMSQLLLNNSQREQAQAAFISGKRQDYPLEAELQPFRELTRRLPHLRQLFMEILLNGALADGMMSAAERLVLERVTRALGLPLQMLDELIRRRGRQSGSGPAFGQGRQSGQRQRYHQSNAEPDPYKVLGISRNADNSELKRAYRKLMSQYHPDKLSGRDVPATMRDYAQTKVREVRAAYDTIKEQRGLK